MIAQLVIVAIGMAAGFLLLRRVPRCASALDNAAPSISIVIPARNEERNLPRLLNSIQESRVRPVEVIVVNDASSDRTAEVAVQFGATVIVAQPLPAGWTGKAWACFQGAWESKGDYILFLDADTFFIDNGLERLIASWSRAQDPNAVLSVLPYHQMRSGYEQLSLFFNLLMAAGAGGFGGVSEPQLFGQCLFIPRILYFSSGGHSAVREAVTENLSLARPLRKCGARIICLVGQTALHMRMFPDGLGQLTESWSKSFIRGATASPASILALSALWISSLFSASIALIFARGSNAIVCGVFYLFMTLQLAALARKIGNYRLRTCLLYPIPLIFYCTVFFSAAARRAFGGKFVWRGREV